MFAVDGPQVPRRAAAFACLPFVHLAAFFMRG